ncbi:MAG: hypothetical protein UR22_C0027G0009, partial [Parcubacteria group bacterium GW2011_GWC2_32_10]
CDDFLITFFSFLFVFFIALIIHQSVRIQNRICREGIPPPPQVPLHGRLSDVSKSEEFCGRVLRCHRLSFWRCHFSRHRRRGHLVRSQSDRVRLRERSSTDCALWHFQLRPARKRLRSCCGEWRERHCPQRFRGMAFADSKLP